MVLSYGALLHALVLRSLLITSPGYMLTKLTRTILEKNPELAVCVSPFVV
jgi:hypothetical protein